jgi:hypothetical protein
MAGLAPRGLTACFESGQRPVLGSIELAGYVFVTRGAGLGTDDGSHWLVGLSPRHGSGNEQARRQKYSCAG